MTNERFSALFGEPVRNPDELLTPFHMDVAASIQAVLDEIVLRLDAEPGKQTGARNLCLAGGVALNCVANGKVLARRCIREYLDPARGGRCRRRRRGGACRGAPLCQPTARDQWRRQHGRLAARTEL